MRQDWANSVVRILQGDPVKQLIIFPTRNSAVLNTGYTIVVLFVMFDVICPGAVRCLRIQVPAYQSVYNAGRSGILVQARLKK